MPAIVWLASELVRGKEVHTECVRGEGGGEGGGGRDQHIVGDFNIQADGLCCCML